MKKSLLVLSMLLAGAAIGTVVSVNAHGFMKGDTSRAEHKAEMFQHKADFLGLDVEQIEAYRDQGLTFGDIMEEQGVTPDDFHAKMLESKTEYLNQLVADGTITQEQLDEKLQWMTERHEKMQSGEWQPKHGKGFGHRKMWYGDTH